MSIPSVEAPPDNEPARQPRVADQPWLDGTQLCAQVDLDLFFPTDDDTSSVSAAAMFFAAKKVCASCPLQDLCARHAIEHHEYGVWGGTSENWRRHLRKRTADPAARRAAVEAYVAKNQHVHARRADEQLAAS